MTGKFKKYLSIVLIAFLMLYNTMLPGLSLAEEVTPTPTPTPTAETQVDNSTQTSNSIDTTSNTGDNAINPTPTPTPEETLTTEQTQSDLIPTPTPEQTDQLSSTPSAQLQTQPEDSPSDSSDTTINNSAEVSNDVSSEGNSGNNSINATSSAQIETEKDSSCQVGGNEATVDTGNAVSVTNVENSLNTTSVNSEVVYQTINLFVNENGNLNISDPFTIAASVIPEYPNDSVINVSVTNVENYAYLSNEVISYANTGGNSINSSNTATMSAVINTGDAYSLVSLLNKVNFTVINSKIHIISINIFGNLNGNIVLPDLSTSQSLNCDTCGISLSASNNATLENNVDSSAVTGENSISGLSGTITTGDVNSIVNMLNILNTTFFGTAVQGLYINILGSWMGNFIGWGALSPQSGGGNLVFYNTGPLVGNGNGCPSCTGDTTIQNYANVINNISSTANTGENTINGGNGTITTGNAFSAVSLINLINTNFINSFGFFGFLNIFGNWTGDIGGQAEFESLEGSPEETVLATSAENNDVREKGGLLAVSQTNNVGAYVLPGDTVTFFVKVKNTGSGKVYETKLRLYLIKDGNVAGGTTFDLGAIPAGRAVNLTTGFVLSKNAPGGQYVARAEAFGSVGPDKQDVSAFSDSTFSVLGNSYAPFLGESTKDTPSVLGESSPIVNNQNSTSPTDRALYTLLAVIIAYVAIRGVRQRKQLAEMFSRNISFKEKLVAFRMFLL